MFENEDRRPDYSPATGIAVALVLSAAVLVALYGIARWFE